MAGKVKEAQQRVEVEKQIKKKTAPVIGKALCKGMPHGSCKGEQMCDLKNSCFYPA